MPDSTLHEESAEFAGVLGQFMRMRARLTVVKPEDMARIMAILDEANPSGKAATKVEYNMLFSVGMILSHDGPVTMGELSRQMDVPLSTATRIVDWLVATHFVSRQHDPDDRRIVHVGLTESGQNMLRVHANYMRNRIEKLLQYFSRDERQNLLALMRKLANALEEEGRPAGSGERSFE